MNKILITGGSGYIGYNLINALNSKEYELHVLTKNKRKSFLFNSNIILHNYEEIINKKINFSAIVHLAYGTDIGVRNTFNLNKKLMNNIFEIAKINGCKVILASSIAVAGYCNNKKFDYHKKLKRLYNDDTYTIVKGKLERYFIKKSEKLNIPYTVIRIGNVMGPGSIWARILVGNLTKSIPCLYIDGKSNATSIYNLIRLITNEINNKSGAKIILSAEHSEVSWLEWAQKIIPNEFHHIIEENLIIHDKSCKTKNWLHEILHKKFHKIKENKIMLRFSDFLPKKIKNNIIHIIKMPKIEEFVTQDLNLNLKKVFSCKYSVIPEGIKEVPIEFTTNQIRKWAIWSNYFVEFEMEVTKK